MYKLGNRYLKLRILGFTVYGEFFGFLGSSNIIVSSLVGNMNEEMWVVFFI